jgi:hypothetical protein
MKIVFAAIISIFSLSSIYAQVGGVVPEPDRSPNPVTTRLERKRPEKAHATAPCVEVSEATPSPKPLENNNQLQLWLRDISEKRRLVKVVPVDNSKSLFWFTKEGTGVGWKYYLKIYTEPLSEFEIKTHIDEIEGTLTNAGVLQFLGLHKFDENSYVLVFYYEKK